MLHMTRINMDISGMSPHKRARGVVINEGQLPFLKIGIRPLLREKMERAKHTDLRYQSTSPTTRGGR